MSPFKTLVIVLLSIQASPSWALSWKRDYCLSEKVADQYSNSWMIGRFGIPFLASLGTLVSSDGIKKKNGSSDPSVKAEVGTAIIGISSAIWGFGMMGTGTRPSPRCVVVSAAEFKSHKDNKDSVVESFESRESLREAFYEQRATIRHLVFINFLINASSIYFYDSKGHKIAGGVFALTGLLSFLLEAPDLDSRIEAWEESPHTQAGRNWKIRPVLTTHADSSTYRLLLTGVF